MSNYVISEMDYWTGLQVDHNSTHEPDHVIVTKLLASEELSGLIPTQQASECKAFWGECELPCCLLTCDALPCTIIGYWCVSKPFIYTLT